MSQSAKILIAEDEPKIAALVAEYLHADGYESVWLAEGDGVISCMERQRFDLLLLDVMLPGKDGVQILKEVRASSGLPVIMLTARVEEIDRLLGLELGADDYICKPFSPREVVARVRAVLRRVRGTSASSPFTVDEDARRITINDRPVSITPSEYRLLSTLIAHPGRVYSRDQLLDLLHADLCDVSDRAVDSHIKNLRRKLEDYLPGVSCIHSVYGLGYRFECEP